MPHKSRWTVPIPDCSLPTLLFGSSSSPLGNEKCLIDAQRPETHYLTRETFRLWSLRLAKGLTNSEKFTIGSRVLLFSANDFMVPVVVMGTACAGGIFTGANPTFMPRELAHQLRDSRATYLFCSDSALDTGIEAARLAGLPLDQVFVYNSSIYDGRGAKGTGPIKGCQYWDSLLASENDAQDFAWDDRVGPNSSIALNYSSGTTGVPKGVEITHRNYVANTLQVLQTAQNHKDYVALNDRARWLCFLPLYHAYGQTSFIAIAFIRRIPVYVMGKFDLLTALEHVQQYRITELWLVPPMAVALAKHPAVSKYDLSSVEFIFCGAAPLGQDVCLQVEKRFDGRVNVKQGWGMTELTCSVLGWDANAWSTSNSVGELNANCEAKIMSEDGTHEITKRGPAGRGELWIRAPNVMKGYWNNAKATQEILTHDGWLRSGDIVYVDEHGHFFIVDRIKELIKVKGNQVAPAELEALLLEHPAVADVAVIGIPTEDGDEKPRAFVVRQPDARSQQIGSADLAAFVEGQVVSYKRLAGGVEFITAIPKNPSGKILRRVLRDIWQAKRQERALL